MKLEFILADTTWQSMKAALSSLSLQAKNNISENYLVLVPETKTFEAEQLLLKDNDAFMNVSINSFDRLLEKMDVQISQKPLTREIGIMLIRKIVYEMKDDLVCFKKSASAIGFIEQIYDTISQIKSSGLSPEEFSLTANNAKQSLKLKLKDISLIYDAYQSELSSTYSDASDRLDILGGVVKDSEWIKNSHVLICGYDSLTTKAMDMIKAIVITAKDTTIACSFMHPDSKNYHIAETEVFDKFKTLAASLNIPYNPSRYYSEYKSDFKQLKDNLFSYPITAIKPEGDISLFNFASPYFELDNICKLIKSKVKNGARYRDIAIVYCNLEDNKRLIEEKMKEYEIPYFISKPYDFATHPIFACIKNFLDVVRKGLDQLSVISFCKNFFVNFDGIYDFENYCMQYGISRNKFLKPIVAKNDKDKECLENAEMCRWQFIKIYNSVIDGFRCAKTYGDFVNGVKALLCELHVESKIEELQRIQIDLDDNTHNAISMQVLDKVYNVLDTIVSFLGNTGTTLEEFILLLQSGLASSDISLIPQTVDSLRIQANADGLNEIEHLFICNAVEGNFPIKSEDCGMISDSEILYLSENTNRKIEPTIRTLNRRERFRAFELMLLPTKSLTISAPHNNVKGEEEKPSSLFAMISKMFFDGENYLEIKNNAFNMDALKIDDDLFAEFNPTVNNATRNFLQASHVQNKAANILSENRVNDLYFSLKDHGLEYEKLKEESERKDKYINNAKDLFFKNGRTSVSELESYFNCPFLHFVNFGLKIKERQQSDIRAVDVGDILHQLVENYMKGLAKGKEEDPKKLLYKILANEKYILEDNKILIKILEDESVRICAALKKEFNVSLFKPTYFEMWYGENGKIKALHIDDDVRIEGKIDRIDCYNDKLRVIDYKTGKIDDKPADIYYGKKIQLITYLCALEQLRKKPVASLYFPIRNEFAGSEAKSESAYKMQGVVSCDEEDALSMDRTLSFDNPKSQVIDLSISTLKKNRETGTVVVNQKTNTIKPELFDGLQSYIKNLIRVAVEEIKKGYIAAAPLNMGELSPCDYCKYRNICGIKENGNDARKTHGKITLENIAEVEDE